MTTRTAPPDLAPDRNAVHGDRRRGRSRRSELASRSPESRPNWPSTKDRLLRALAETENVRRRAQREREDARKYAASNFAKDLLDVADNLRRALGSVARSARSRTSARKACSRASPRPSASCSRAFERNGIKRIDPMGERFDPQFPPGDVRGARIPASRPAPSSQVLQPGYRMHDRLLRPAMVGVAKGDRSAGAGVDEVV